MRGRLDGKAQPTDTPAVELRDVHKAYTDVKAVAGIDLTIAAGEFFTMLGPSGSGKTTLLRVIAGFERVDGGSVLLDGTDVTSTPPYDRQVNTVFQDYALFPHMTVGENVGYGLAVRKVPRAERKARVEQALELVRLPGLGDRKPSQLSGGQRQRVALARALVNEPKVLLLDEPLGALDLKLRQEMQLFLKQMQRELAITFLYVTHDQEEALTMSDRIAVMRDGSLAQVGTPVELYERPADEFVANFVGVSNLVTSAAGHATIRPERISLDGDASPPSWRRVSGTISDVLYIGMITRFVVNTDDGSTLIATRQNDRHFDAQAHPLGQRVTLAWDPNQEYQLSSQPPSGGHA
jgi:putative spermidine/putrescine transport system ATP-binding protein